jgi:hypothetical protein
MSCAGGFTQKRKIRDSGILVLAALCLLSPRMLAQNALATGSGSNNSPFPFQRSRPDFEKPKYEFVRIDYPQALATRSLGIGAQGTIVGSFDDDNGTHGFVLREGRFSQIDFPSAIETDPKSINARGEIVGYYFDSDFNLHGFYNFRGRFRAIDIPFSIETRAESIDEEDVISGEYVDQAGNEHGYLLRDEQFETIDVPDSLSTDVWGVSNDGWLAGDYSDATTVRAYVRPKRGPFITLDVPGSVAASVRSINDRHEVVGRWDDNSVPPVQLPCTTQCHGFYWHKGKFYSIEFPGALYTIALGINNAGLIVGRYVDGSNNEHGFLARPKDESD